MKRLMIFVKGVFLVWYITLLFLVGYIYLSQQGKLAYILEFFNFLITINIIAGVAAIIFILVKHILSNYIILFLFIVLLVGFALPVFIISPLVKNQILVKTSFSAASPFSFIKDMRLFYSRLFFEILGYPADDRMATKKELFEAVRQYRTDRNLPPLEENQTLCRLADQEMTELYTVGETKRYEKVKKFTLPAFDFKEAAAIVQSSPNPHRAPNIVESYWANPNYPTAEILNDPKYTYGCVQISEYNIAFIFGWK